MRQLLILGPLVAAAAACVLSGALPPAEFSALMGRIGPIMVFVTAATVVSYLADAAGLFRVLTRFTARLGRGRTFALWVLVLGLTSASSIFLSLDTAVVLITPLVVGLAVEARLPPIVFALSTVWLANTASMLLPVSNLTNLLAQEKADLHPLEYAATVWAPAAAGILVPAALLWLAFRRFLRGRYTDPSEPVTVPDRGLLVLSGAVVALLLPALVSGIHVAIPASAAAIILAAGFLVRQRSAFAWDMVPVMPVVLAVSLFVLVQTAHSHGLASLLAQAAGSGEGFGDLLQLAGAGAVASNAVNNLPAYLALEPAADTPVRLAALLVGVNMGAIVTPWGSLATLLWYDRMRSMGVAVRWGRFIAASSVAAVVTVTAATAALSLAA
ncbi:arsenic transporter [Arthrobacter sp. zg-Y40]|uniref:SLC13 family permease n=1 Tax=unclassified Arthrobacter TaxID=235627 RepID=UPI001D153661|nr:MULTISPECIES: SLC13 family permease [unclassified Arthrobacter]MCC3277954.1 arsenic transporter [Arthrobacter sp. zg-Y40]MDK1326947.1 ArsB/NhaD family transporter [Arthrobacter sp. zg-Y1143]